MTSANTLVIILFFVASLTAIARVHEVPKSEFWYTCTRILKAPTLPQKFILSEKLILQNPNEEPLFVLINGKKEIKIQDSIVYQLGGEQWNKVTYPEVVKTGYADDDGTLVETGRKLNLEKLNIENGNLIVAAAEKVKLVREWTNKRGAGRPSGVLPATVNYQVLVEFQGKRHTIEVSYPCSLNAEYSPK